ncbi:transcription antitermination factor NusB [Megalodesulfovibrio gigas]|uniref:Putative Fmu (Sun) domain protein n=1 Tax=Megalodesulfovibrio gigas (strain ATCC 19364 / DSM 1382 / NCIMB 9332 / VKM B-1759) TaxID=1121448 RepID=T2G9E9_MEGG1|nr:transcription antitermination factor NusB [Megalodesulfovibrio gigas]AGW12746.1 putative Fmu (Sun) domain protein [Megalodesulfovibrio gigas DSM 1382 = ATCC 19364]
MATPTPPLSGNAVPAARRCALDVLTDVLGTQRPLQEALDARLSGDPALKTSPKDRALATNLVYGTLRHMGRLESILGRFLRKPGNVPPAGSRILLAAAYELLFLHRIPAYATLNWAVEAMKRQVGPQLAGLANAVLRKVADIGPAHQDLSTYRRGNDFKQAAAAYYSLPPWLIDLLIKEKGREEALLYMEAFLREPPLGLRINRTRPGHEAVFTSIATMHACLGAELPWIMLHPDNDLDVASLVEKGMASRQSAASQAALQALQPADWPTPVWDACAGHGGKTLWLVEAGVQPVWASDVHRGRLAGLKTDAVRLGLPVPPVFAASGTQPPPLRHAPRTILLDAPCTGLGVIARRPDIKWHRRPEEVQTLARVQRQLLERCWSVLPSGGRLAYITCTLTHAENAGQVERFLAGHADARELTRHATPPASLAREFFFASLLEKR